VIVPRIATGHLGLASLTILGRRRAAHGAQTGAHLLQIFGASLQAVQTASISLISGALSSWAGPLVFLRRRLAQASWPCGGLAALAWVRQHRVLASSRPASGSWSCFFWRLLLLSCCPVLVLLLLLLLVFLRFFCRASSRFHLAACRGLQGQRMLVGGDGVGVAVGP